MILSLVAKVVRAQWKVNNTMNIGLKNER